MGCLMCGPKLGCLMCGSDKSGIGCLMCGSDRSDIGCVMCGVSGGLEPLQSSLTLPSFCPRLGPCTALISLSTVTLHPSILTRPCIPPTSLALASFYPHSTFPCSILDLASLPTARPPQCTL
eukprot:3778958-Rhodomonas_salina.1